jgi:hypothetical protein
MRTETDPFSETLCFLEYQTMDKAQKPSNAYYALCMEIGGSIETRQRAITADVFGSVTQGHVK